VIKICLKAEFLGLCALARSRKKGSRCLLSGFLVKFYDAIHRGIWATALKYGGRAAEISACISFWGEFYEQADEKRKQNAAHSSKQKESAFRHAGAARLNKPLFISDPAAPPCFPSSSADFTTFADWHGRKIAKKSRVYRNLCQLSKANGTRAHNCLISPCYSKP